MTTKLIHKIRVRLSGSWVYLLLPVVISGLLNSCVVENNETPIEKNEISLRMGDSSQEYVMNTEIHLFNGANDRYNHKQQNVRLDIANSTLSMNMLAGNWNLVILSNNRSLSSIIQPPNSGTERNKALMYKMEESADGILLDMPEEFRYALLPNVTIVANQEKVLSATLTRNACKIEVVLEETNGTDHIVNGSNDNAFAEILNVPNCLNWAGGLYPDKEPTSQNPQGASISDKPMKKKFVFDAQGKAETITFIVPAHRGVDASDVSAHKLNLRVCMPVDGKPDYGLGIAEIPYVPLPNKIIRLRVKFGSQVPLDIKVSVKDWEDEKDQTGLFS